MAYTYLLGWPKLNKYYYGVRFAKTCNPSELWVTYFTSSRHVANFRKLHGNPDIIQIRKIFNSTEKARLWESTVLQKLKVVTNEKWLNETDNLSISAESARLGGRRQKGVPKSFEHKEKIRQTLTGCSLSEETKNKIKDWHANLSIEDKNALNVRRSNTMKGKMIGSKNPMYGKTHSEEVIKKLTERMTHNNPMSGKTHSEETKQKMRLAKQRHKELV